MLVWGPGGPHANTRVEVHMANTQELSYFVALKK
jgi:hypothetical protein